MTKQGMRQQELPLKTLQAIAELFRKRIVKVNLSENQESVSKVYKLQQNLSSETKQGEIIMTTAW